MKKLFLSLAVIVVCFYGCKMSDKGELVGVQDRPYFEDIDLKGMVFIEQGNFSMGAGNQNETYGITSQPRTMQVSSFYMDETEITNNEYRQCVVWVQDSIARRMLVNAGVEGFQIEEAEDGEPREVPLLNKKAKIRWNEPEIREALNDLYFSEKDRLMGRRDFDPSKLNYEYYWVDYRQAAQKETNVTGMKDEYRGTMFGNRPKGLNNRSSFIRKEVINVYPDTLCWIHDYTYSMNDDYSSQYFNSPAYDNYPVVGITWKQARAFCAWRSMYLNDYLSSIGYATMHDFRLPTEAEWEYAARGGMAQESYPWGGPYVRNPNGCFLANYEPLKGAYDDDGGVRTLMVGHYAPNDYGLYDMAGNVSEWCNDSYNESTYIVANALAPTYNYSAGADAPLAMQRKVVRGGSWKDQKYFIQVQTRSYEFQDTSKSFIGFRCVQTYMGRVKGDNLKTASNVN